MQIKDILTENVQYVDPKAPLPHIAKIMKDYNCGSVPVADNDRLVGMVTDRDIVIRCVAQSLDPRAMTAEQCMTPDILYCYDTDQVEDILQNMADNAVRRMPVVNKEKDLVGIISFGDLSAACEDKEMPGKAMERIRKAA